ncbi:hypothetical protein Pme01_49510 [Planosporangium mesophilum]|uniref:Uncharacterized protein n=2 Tax=Planosporangium mesophilum TaxID=689768 RepID=A0A8J3X3C8_9ACTN|nr:hypothetical protein Pme01_49510 [Planosporangium mesophilum]
MLTARPTVRLADMLDGVPVKGRQPIWADEDEIDDDTPYAVATITIQSGMIARDRAKPTTKKSVERFSVRTGDLLVSMDGDGSLGKAAVYDGDKDGTIDSHIARCRLLGGLEAADAASCWLNSTWGRVQTTSLMTGSTGQTQLNPADLLDVLIPADLVTRANEISVAYRAALSAFEPVTRRARRMICAASADVTELLVANGAIRPGALVDEFTDPDQLLQRLDVLYPSTRV